MAGRVAVLLANGVEPKNIAAITFTEFAASELHLRIEEFTTTLSKGEVPRDLDHLLPRGVTLDQKEKVERACRVIDQLACTTIHGFAQALLKPYPAEAQIDPGAEIVDPAEADLAFEERYEGWLKRRLSGNGDDGIVEALILGDEAGGLRLVAEVAQFLRRNRDATPAAAAWSHDSVKRFAAAAVQFEKGLSRIDYREEQTEAACNSFIELKELLGGLALKQAKPSNHDFVAAINLPRHEASFRQDGKRRKLQTKGKWQAAATAAGRSKGDGKCAYDALNGRYETSHDTFEALLAAIAGELLARLAAQMQGLIQDWREYKRATALLDFDDLLYTARDLLVGHEDVRRALSTRFRHVLVDEFQDTDPLQIEILGLVCGEWSEGSKDKQLAWTLRPGALRGRAVGSSRAARVFQILTNAQSERQGARCRGRVSSTASWGWSKSTGL
jgi:ATP-dependent exoDNAse (exonuclease V) beta subunit